MERFFFRSAQLRCSSLVSFSNFVYSLYFPYMDSCHLLETFIAHPSGYGEVQGSLLALLSIHCVVLEPSLLTESTCYTLHFSQSCSVLLCFFCIGCAAPNEKPLHTPAYHHLETIIHSSVSYRLINTTLCPCSAFQRSSNSAWCCLSAEQQNTLLILSHLTIANLATLTFSFFLHKRKKNANSK